MNIGQYIMAMVYYRGYLPCLMEILVLRPLSSSIVSGALLSVYITPLKVL